MAIQRADVSFGVLDAGTLAAWRDIPPAIVSDCMNRTQFMDHRIKPLAPGTVLAGQARTVRCMAGDNSAIHMAASLIEPGQVLVIDAGGHSGVALWGGLLTLSARARGCAGVVIDGAVRDASEIREAGFPCFSAAIVPAGPHKGFGGVIDGTISCAGAVVSAGDIIVGDDDGVAVVPLARQAALLEASKARLAAEEAMAARIAKGETTAEILGLGEVEPVDP